MKRIRPARPRTQADKAAAPRLEPSDLGINACARCGHRLRAGAEYRRGMTRGPAGLLLFIVCEPCAEQITRDAEAGDAFDARLSETLADAVLAATPVGGRA